MESKVMKKEQYIRKIILFLSFFSLPITMNYFSPVLIIAGGFTKTLVFSHLVYGAMFISSLFVGRGFCSYVCPLGGMQDTYSKATGQKSRNYKIMPYIKLFIGASWLGTVVYTLLFVGLEKVNLLFATEKGFSIDDSGGIIRYFMIFGGILFVAMISGKRGFCKTLCPMSILNIIGTKIRNSLKIPGLKLTSEKEKCVDCKMCNKVCPMGLNVAKMAKEEKFDSINCILCGECASACSKNALCRKIR